VVESLVRNRLKGHRRGGPIDRRRGYELRELREVARAGHLPVGAVAREHQRSWIVGRFPASAASGRPAPGPHVLDGHSGARGSSTRHADPGEITSVLSKARDAGRNGRKRSHRERAKGSHRPRCRSRRPTPARTMSAVVLAMTALIDGSRPRIRRHVWPHSRACYIGPTMANTSSTTVPF
jgi:hypothetical protein